MRTSPDPNVEWRETQQSRTVALNASSRWFTITVELALGFLMLPFNTRYLGAEDYGLWMLAASIVVYFPVLNLGYAGAMDRFVAHYRAKRDAQAINEVASTLFFLFAVTGAIGFGIVTLVSMHVGTLFSVSAEQIAAGRAVMLLVGLQFAIGLPIAVFGSVVNGFQRTYLNSIVGTVVALAVALVNVVVLMSGGDLVQLVAATTATRVLGFIAYRSNAHRVFPLLRIRYALVRRARLRELTGFSVYVLMQTLSNKVNYASDPIVIGAFVSTGAVAIWTVAQRLSDMVLQITNQLNDVLFPVVVDCDSSQRDDRLREVLVQGTKICLALAVPVAGALALLAEQVVLGWIGPQFVAAAILVQILAAVVVIRVATATAATVLKGAGHIRLLAWSTTASAVVNIVLSIILLQLFGLPGVAIASLIPIAVRSVFIVVPVACQRVGMPLRTFVVQAVWPCVWPGIVSLGLLAAVRDQVAPSLIQCVLYGLGAWVIYAVLFVGVALGRDDRRRYATRLRGLRRVPALNAA